MRTAFCSVVLLALVLPTGPAFAGDWPRFRGPNGSAVSSETGLPTTWSESENLAWKVELPGPGSSSPIVSGNRVFVTCYSGYGARGTAAGNQGKLVRRLLCIDLENGKLLWQKSVKAVLPEDPYEGQLTEHGYATSTPAADGERVFVFFGKSGVHAFDFEGKPLWQQNVGTGSAIMGWGSAASPLLYQNLVIVNANAENESIVALDKKDGRQVWKAKADGYAGSWSTPVLVETAQGKQELVVHMPDEIWALSPASGGVLWYCSGVRGSATTSLIAGEGVVYAVGGGPGGSGAIAVRAGGKGDVSTTGVLWRHSAGSYVPSPVLVGGHLYWADDRGTVFCLKADTGKQVYRQRLEGAHGVYASAVAADGKLYVVSRRNGTFVLAASPQFKLLAHNRLASDSTDFNASPAASQGSLLLRSNRFLYCVRRK